jgi:PAS domain S-box-containing protein
MMPIPLSGPDTGDPFSRSGEAIVRDQKVARWLGITTVIAGAIILFGWIADIPTLKALFPGQVEAKANTALCFILCGVGLALKAGRRSMSGVPGLLANLFAALAAVTGLLTLVQYVAGNDLGLDQILIVEPVGAVDTVHPGRMAMPSALTFLLLGTAVLLLERLRGRMLLLLLVLPTCAIAGLAFVGQLYDFPFLATFGPFSPIPAPTGLVSLVLGVGILHAGSSRFLASLRRSAGSIGFAAALSLLAIMGGAVAHNARTLVQANESVSHTHQVLGKLGDLSAAMQDAEIGMRGYLLTGNPLFLEPYGPAPARVRQALRDLRTLTSDNPVQQVRVTNLEGMIESRLSFAEQSIRVLEKEGPTNVLLVETAEESKRFLDAVRPLVEEMMREERRLLETRKTHIAISTRKTMMTLGLGMVFSVGLLFAVFRLLRGEIARRVDTAAALRRSEEDLAVTLNSIGDGVLATDTAGRITRMNRIAEELTGWSTKDAKGRPIAEVFRIINEGTRAPARIPVDDVLATGRIQELANHTVLIARNGTERPIADSAAPIRDERGRIHGVVLVFRDVTTEYAARRALEDSERRYRTLFESIDEGFCIIEMIFDQGGAPVDYRFLETSPSFEKQTGMRDARGRLMRELAPLHESHWFETYGRVAVTGEPIRFQNRAEQLGRTFDVYAFRFGDPQKHHVAVLFSDVTERHQAETALRRSEESLAVTLNSIGDAVLATDTAGRVTRMNRVAEQLTGWGAEEARGRPIAEVFCILHEQSRLPAPIPVEQVLATGEIEALADHTMLVARDGTERAIADSAAPIRDTLGRILGVVLVFRDVSMERVAEIKLAAALEELARERARLRFIFDSLPVGISFARTEPDGRRTRLINDAHLKICGITREQADEPGVFARITHPDDRAVQERLRQQIEEGSLDGMAIDKRYVQPGGQVVWVMYSVRRQRFADGSYEELSMVADITKRKNAEEELTRFFSLSLDFLCIAGMDGWFKRASPAVTEVLGWTVEEFLARPYMEQIHPDDRAASAEAVQRQAAGHKVMHHECRFRHKDGTWRMLSWRSAPHGGLMYATARDVTDARGKEQQIHELNRNLAQRALQFEQANRELESFSYSVSHDLRAPLRHVQGYVEMLAREMGDGLSDKSRRYLKTIADAAREMGELIDDLLAFSRMGRSEMREAEVDLNPLIDEVRAGLEPNERGRSIRWNVATLPRVRGDAAMLRQVLVNLLGNAVKYSRHKDPAEIEIGCGGRAEDRLVLFVRDNGAGFDMKFADKLFGVFQRLHRADEFEGTGIGLASVRRIIARHGGRTWAESQINAGATFYFTLQPAENDQSLPPVS